jgi:hypothetical protein
VKIQKKLEKCKRMQQNNGKKTWVNKQTKMGGMI